MHARSCLRSSIVDAPLGRKRSGKGRKTGDRGRRSLTEDRILIRARLHLLLLSIAARGGSSVALHLPRTCVEFFEAAL